MSFEEKLINIVKKQEVIYNKSSRGYKNIKVKFEIWKKIGEELGESDETCRLRWKSLRDKFSRELKLLQESSGSANKCRQEWEFFKNMRFLTDFIKCRKTLSNFTDFQDEDTTEAGTEVSISLDEWEPVSQSTNNRKRKRSANEEEEIEDTIKTTLTALNSLLAEDQRNSSISVVKNSDDKSFKRLRSVFDGLQAATKQLALNDMMKYLCELQIQGIQNSLNAVQYCDV